MHLYTQKLSYFTYCIDTLEHAKATQKCMNKHTLANCINIYRERHKHRHTHTRMHEQMLCGCRDQMDTVVICIEGDNIVVVDSRTPE